MYRVLNLFSEPTIFSFSLCMESLDEKALFLGPESVFYPLVESPKEFPQGFPGDSESKESARSAGDPGAIPRLGGSPGKGMATHSIILVWRSPWTGGAWQACYIIPGVAELDTTE